MYHYMGYRVLYNIMMPFMEDDPYFCMCGCSPWYWNVYRFVFKPFTNKEWRV